MNVWPFAAGSGVQRVFTADAGVLTLTEVEA